MSKPHISKASYYHGNVNIPNSVNSFKDWERHYLMQETILEFFPESSRSMDERITPVNSEWHEIVNKMQNIADIPCETLPLPDHFQIDPIKYENFVQSLGARSEEFLSRLRLMIERHIERCKKSSAYIGESIRPNVRNASREPMTISDNDLFVTLAGSLFIHNQFDRFIERVYAKSYSNEWIDYSLEIPRNQKIFLKRSTKEDTLSFYAPLNCPISELKIRIKKISIAESNSLEYTTSNYAEVHFIGHELLLDGVTYRRDPYGPKDEMHLKKYLDPDVGESSFSISTQNYCYVILVEKIS